MSNPVLILGGSGTGKTTSMRTLDPKTTFIINVLGKDLPFRGYKKKYTCINGWEDKQNNYFVSDDWTRIVRCIKMVNEDRPEIQTLIIDDLQYVMSFEFLRRAHEKSYEKFTEIAVHLMAIINACNATRSDLLCFLMAHNEVDALGHSKLKTVGKLLEEKLTIEGVFTCTLHSLYTPEGYKFMTNTDGFKLSRSPMGMFDKQFIDNDLKNVRDTILEYYNDGE